MRFFRLPQYNYAATSPVPVPANGGGNYIHRRLAVSSGVCLRPDYSATFEKKSHIPLKRPTSSINLKHPRSYPDRVVYQHQYCFSSTRRTSTLYDQTYRKIYAMDMNRPHLGIGDGLERRHSDTSVLQTTQMVFERSKCPRQKVAVGTNSWNVFYRLQQWNSRHTRTMP